MLEPLPTKRLVHTNYRIYLSIAKEAKSTAEEIHGRLDSLLGQHREVTLEYVKAHSSVTKQSKICIVFSAMAIEAFINEYAVNKLSKKFFKSHLDRMSLLTKLILVPRLAKDTELEKDGQLYEDCKWLIDYQNYLVHFHAKTEELSQIDPETFTDQKYFVDLKHAKRAVRAADQLVLHFGDIEWDLE